MNCAGENTATLSARKLKGALLPNKIKSRTQTKRERLPIEKVFIIDHNGFLWIFHLRGKILPFQKGIRKHHWYVMDYIPEEAGLSTS